MSAIDAMHEMRDRLGTLIRDGSRYEKALAQCEEDLIQAKDRLRNCYELQDSYTDTLSKLGVPLPWMDMATRVDVS